MASGGRDGECFWLAFCLFLGILRGMERFAYFRFGFWIAASLAAAGSIGYGIAGVVIDPNKVPLSGSAAPDPKERYFRGGDFRAESIVRPHPSMARMKREGCIMDGLLSGYGHEKTNVDLAKRLPCYSFHRALETWLEPPDFKKAETILTKVGKPDAVWGMFLAEAIYTKAQYYSFEEDRLFSFSDMCRPDTKNRWGEHTCVPFTGKKEYRKYLEEITSQAMDIGIQNFLFGQVFLQDDLNDTRMPDIIRQMRKDAQERNMEIVIGAQTNDIIDPEYLKLFDYIEGGVGLASDGTVEENPCFSRWWKKEGDWCWALLWNGRFALNANNVWVHLDWSGRRGDDMSTFARMNGDLRSKTLQSLHRKFQSMDIGFILPVFTALPEQNGGCYGEEERFYSANEKFGCKDEGAITDILERARRGE